MMKNPQPGDRVLTLLQGTVEKISDDGYIIVRGNTVGAEHLDWVHHLHWSTEFLPAPEGDMVSREVLRLVADACGDVITATQREAWTLRGRVTEAARQLRTLADRLEQP